MGRLAGKVIGLTGAAGGLGMAAARMFAREGAKLALTDVKSDGLEQFASELRGAGARIVTQAGDVTDPATHKMLVDAAINQHGGLHGWCNIAGISGPGDIEYIGRDDFFHVMNVNCYAQLLGIQHAAPAMKAGGGGSIVNVASVGALAALPHLVAYCASKSAVLGMTRAVAVELSPDIRCNVVCPGGIDTPMARVFVNSVPREDQEALIAKLTGRQILKRFAQPEEIAATLLFLVSDESSFLTGATIAAEGGHTAW